MSSDKKYCIKLEECECGSKGSLPDLSFEEQFAGFHDENGDAVYLKSISLGALVNSTKKYVPHNIAYLKSVVDLTARYWDPDGFGIGTWANDSSAISFFADRENIIVEVSNQDRRNNEAIVILYYTCTDR